MADDDDKDNDNDIDGNDQFKGCRSFKCCMAIDGNNYDDIKNGDETDVDCGGSCIQCLGT